MEDLLVRSIGWSADATALLCAREVLDVVQYHICRLPVPLVVLTASDGCDVRRDTGVYDDVLFSGMVCDWQTSQNLEAVTEVQFPRYITQDWMQVRQRERFLVDEPERLVESYVAYQHPAGIIRTSRPYF